MTGIPIPSEGEPLVVRRRRPRGHPLRATKIGAALHASGGPSLAQEFPGILVPDTDDPRHRWISRLLAFALHGMVIGGLVLATWLAPQVLQEEEPIPVHLLKEPPAAKTSPAPARRVIAERRSAVFQPSAQAVKPQVVNPRVVARAVPQVAGQKLEMNSVSRVAAPRAVANVAAPRVEKVATVRGVAGAVQSRVDVAEIAGPALRGPTQADAPVGASVGPRQIEFAGDTVGTGSVKLGDGSSVREGIASTRDVLGSPTGDRLADVNTAVGEGLLDGSGGTGQGGVSRDDCFARPEVQDYLGEIKNRMYARWVLPPDVPGNQEVRLRMRLDRAGSASGVQLVPGGDAKLGRSAVDALRSAAPFPPMQDRVRCLAGLPIVGTFRNPVGTVAD